MTLPNGIEDPSLDHEAPTDTERLDWLDTPERIQEVLNTMTEDNIDFRTAIDIAMSPDFG